MDDFRLFGSFTGATASCPLPMMSKRRQAYHPRQAAASQCARIDVPRHSAGVFAHAVNTERMGFYPSPAFVS